MASSYDPSLYLSDLGPASPSACLDLPPTPQPQPQHPEPNGSSDDAQRFVRPAENKLAATGNLEEPVVAAPGGDVGPGRGRKNRFDDDEDDLEMDRRSSKQSALQGDGYGDDRDVFDKYKITSHVMCVVEQMEKLRIPMQQEEAAAAGGSATELLRQIKRHASPQGDATQRLAHCFAEGLQARLAGTGSSMVVPQPPPTSVVDILQAYQLYMAAICFKKAAFLFANKTIYNASLGKRKIHIVDYRIHYGFQWPCFLRRVACREGGPPAVRITGIDLPQPGFRPAQRVEETGRRLSKYCQEFGVPFEYQAIAAPKMETIRAEDLNLDPEEVLIVNCMYQFKNLMDESVLIESPRDAALGNIRRMRPRAFVHGVVNGSFGAPFFATRFREALFYYSALFDVLDTTAPRDSDQRVLIEQDIFGRAALNAIACEGTDRVERPETYKQWQVRNQRAGLKQLPLNPSVVQAVRDKVRECYHKDFVIDVDHHWLLQGWKGRILYAISTWVANDDAGSYF
ncbi:scarecrow-like protein 9 [Panicum miliaceum]|uniref:Scarecrow-like protein 9 n=1 Tax=Panicum miliaceum TaxID=4540 RepID=A0A3L6T1Z1_PANMI|nr:scarecrow-like protein 9 [Panicum miliaceum]